MRFKKGFFGISFFDLKIENVKLEKKLKYKLKNKTN